MEIIKAQVEGGKHRYGQTVNSTIHAEPTTLQEISKTLQIGEEKLNIFVERRKPRCFECDEVGHIRWEYPKETKEETTTLETRGRGNNYQG